jgi:transcriptional regulator with XRE-family HTH domain
MKIGQGIIKVCNIRGISQTEISKQTGLSKTFLSLIEHDYRDASMVSLKKISKVLDVPIPVIYWLSLDTDDLKMANQEMARKYKKAVDEIITKMFINGK